jgi:hypothetical protein
MNIQKLKAFFLWCTIINGALVFLTYIIGIAGLDGIYAMQGRLFQVSRESFNSAWYLFLGLYKIAWLVFNAVPYISLLIISRNGIQPDA